MMKPLLTKTVLIALGLILCTLPVQAQKVRAAVLKPAEFKYQMEQTAHPFIIDMRPAADFAAGHILGAVNLNPNDFDFIQAIKDRCAVSDTLFVYCRMGKTSKAAAAKIIKSGFLTVYNLKGGILAWSQHYTVTQ